MSEADRIAALDAYRVLDTLPEEAFDRLTELASEIFDTPIALVSLVDSERQWFKSRQGLAAQSTAREWAFCAHAIEMPPRSVMVVEDATADAQFFHNPLVTGAPDIRFYAGAVLTSPGGFNLGTLCVIDTRPRQALTVNQANCLRRLADIVVDELELRRLVRQSEEKRKLLDMAEQLSGVGRWRFEMASGTVTWSDEAFVIHGLRPELGAPSYGDLLMLYHEDDRGTLEQLVRRAAETGQGYELQARVRRPDGELRNIVAKAETLKGLDGRIEGLFGVFQDVTEANQAERRLQDANTRLQAACAEAEAAAEAKAEFMANMSHELRTPLTAVLGFSKLIEEQNDLAESTRSYIGRVTRGGQALLATVNDILDFSKLEAGQVEIKPRPVSFAQLGRDALDLFALQAREKAIALQAEGLDEAPNWLTIDPDRLRQVLLNLIGNAVKFTEAGVVRLEAKYDASCGRLHIAVADSGSGIAKDQIGRLFQRFSQVDGSSTRQHGGTGLGLAISKGLIEAMGGQIGVESEAGQGSRFWFSIPAPIAAGDWAANALAGEISLFPQGFRILLVDDNSANRALVRTVLTPFEPDITEACDGFEAVSHALSMPFDLILMDLRMPGLDGVGAASRIRTEAGPNGGTPIIAFSADVTGGGGCGLFDAMVSKPISARALIGAMTEALAPSAADRVHAA